MEKFRREIESAAEPNLEEERGRVRAEFLEDLREGNLAAISEEELLRNSNFDRDFLMSSEVQKEGLEGVGKILAAPNLKGLTAAENIKYVLRLPDDKVQEIAKKSFIEHIKDNKFENALLIERNFRIDKSVFKENYIIRAFRQFIIDAPSTFRNNPDLLIAGISDVMMLLESSDGLKRDKGFYKAISKIAIIFASRASFEEMDVFMKWLPDLRVFIENSEELRRAAINNFKNTIEDGASSEAELINALDFIKLFNLPKEAVDSIVESVIKEKLENGELIFALHLADIFSYPAEKLENRVKRSLIDILDGRIDYKEAPDLPEEVVERFGGFLKDIDVLIAAKKFFKLVREKDGSESARRYLKIFRLDELWKTEDIEELKEEYKDALKSGDSETAIDIKDTNRLDESFIKDQAFIEMHKEAFRKALKEFAKFEGADLTEDEFEDYNPATVSDKLDKIAGNFELPEDFITQAVMDFAEEEARQGHMEVVDLLRTYFAIDMDKLSEKGVIEAGLLKSTEKGSTIFRKYDLKAAFINSREFQEAIHKFTSISLKEGNVDPLIYHLKEKLNFPDEFFRQAEFKKPALVALETLMTSELIYSGGDEDEEDEIASFHYERIRKTIELFGIETAEVSKIAEGSFTEFLNDNNIAGAREIYKRFPFSREGYAISEVKRTLSRLLNDEDKEAKSINQIEFLFKSFKPLREIFTYPDVQKEAARKMLQYKAAGRLAAADKIKKIFEIK